MKLRTVTVLTLAGIGGFWSAVSAADQIVEYQVSNGVFDDGGTVSGTFTYDFTSEAYTAVDLVTSATTNPSGNIPQNGFGFSFPGATYTSPISPSTANIDGVDEAATTGTDRIDLVFTTPLSASGVTGLKTSSFEIQSGQFSRDLTSGEVAPVPLPPSSVLLLSGVGALLWGRRRSSAKTLAASRSSSVSC
jgi:hypothetical protein